MGLEELTNLTEVTNRRSYNKKVYDLGEGKLRYICHTSHIHYKDNQGYKDINTKLSFKDNSWKHNTASYHPTIPEYSDSWFEFYNAYEETNHTIKARPICEHIQGKYTESAEGNFVLYTDAFGKGIDLKVYSYWAGLKKVIIVNDKPSDISKPLEFDFELELPTKEETINSKTSIVSAKVIDTKSSVEWVKSETLDFKGKDLKIGLDNKYSYFRDALMWDSSGIVEKVNIQLYQKDGKTYLRKTIPTEFLEKAVFPIYTDHPTSYYSGAGDGHIANTNASTSWNTTHDATGASVISNTDIGFYVGVRFRSADSTFSIWRGFLPIDTSGIDDSATISSAILNVYPTSNTAYDNDGNDWINVVQTSQAGTSTLVFEDFDQCGSIDNPTEGCDTRIDMSSGITLNTYNTWILNSTGIGWISKTGYTKLGLREGHDAIDHAPTSSNGYTYTYFSASEDTSGTKDPYLDITVQTLPTDKTYTRESKTSTPADDTDLATAFTSDDYTAVATDDGNYVSLSSQGNYALFEFKNKVVKGTAFTVTWTGKTDREPSSSTVYLQIYNRNSTTWETIDSDNSSAANADFTLTADVTTNLTNYYDVNGWISCRVYQRAI